MPMTHHFAFDVQNAEVAVAHGHLLERPPPERGLLARVVDLRGGPEALAWLPPSAIAHVALEPRATCSQGPSTCSGECVADSPRMRLTD